MAEQATDKHPRLPLPVDAGSIVDAAIAHAPHGVVLFDREAKIVRVSRSVAARFHKEPDEIIGVCLRGRLDEQLEEALERALRGDTVSVENFFQAGSEKVAIWMRSTWTPLRNESGVVAGGMVMARDVTPEVDAKDLVQRITFFDALTGLPNRDLMTRAVETVFAADRERPRFALVWLNLDRFKAVNDAFGQRFGDRLLQAVAERLSNVLRGTDVLARAGADDFLLLCAHAHTRRELRTVIGRLQRAFLAPFVIEGERLYVATSIGVALAKDGGGDALQLQEAAHTAMRAAKTHGQNKWQLFASKLDVDSVREIRVAYEIREGIESGQFFFCYQPEVQLATMRTVALEALVRWQHPQRGLVPPAEFIPLCEEIGLMETLGAHLLPEACAQLRAWREEFGTDVRLAVNVSAREFQAGGACERIVGALHEAGLPPDALEVEITESAVLADTERAIAVANELRAAGLTIALDDFGTGYSSLTHLHTLPIDKVKIDRSFVMSCLSDPSAAAIVEGIAVLARRLGKTVVAEGVETAEELEFVCRVGCDVAQGYFFAPPLDVEACAAHLRAGGSWSHAAV